MMKKQLTAFYRRDISMFQEHVDLFDMLTCQLLIAMLLHLLENGFELLLAILFYFYQGREESDSWHMS
jgi:hypothetical protein